MALRRELRRRAAGLAHGVRRLKAAANEAGPGPWALAGLYAGLILLPLLVAASTFYPPADLGEDLAAGFGIAALAGLFAQFLFAPAFRPLASGVGFSRIARLHRMAAAAILCAIVLHVVALAGEDLLADPGRALARLATLLAAPGPATGVLAAAVLVILCVLALLRQRIGLPGPVWRLIHTAGAVVATALALEHALRLGLYAEGSALPAAWALLGLLASAALMFLWAERAGRPAALVESCCRLDAGSIEVLLRFAQREDFGFRAGQFVRLAPASTSTAEETRFAIASAPGDLPSVRLLADVAARTPLFVEGTELRVDGPHGASICDGRAAESYLLVAVGSGIAPALAVLRALTFRRERRPVRLVYAAESWDDLLFRGEVEALGKHLDLRFAYAVETRAPPEAPDPLDEEKLEAALAGLDPRRTVAQVSGRDDICAVIVEVLLELGMRSENILFESPGGADARARNPLARRDRRAIRALLAGLGAAVLLFALR